MAAPAHVQTTPISTAGMGTVRKATDGDILSLARSLGSPDMLDTPRYHVRATSDEATNGPIWDSDDPRADSNATESALTFPANTLTPITAFVVVANDDSVAYLTVKCLVKGGASNPTLEAAFENIVSVQATVGSSQACTRVAANSSAGCTIAPDGTTGGDFDIAFPACTAARWLGGGTDPNSDTPTTGALSVFPRSVDPAGTAKVLHVFLDDVPAVGTVPSGHVITANFACKGVNGYGPRSTQTVADLVDCDADFALNTSSSPDSVELNVQGLGSTDLNWEALIWVGQSASVSFVSA